MQAKCEQYWPDNGVANYGVFKVAVVDTETFADYTLRVLSIVHTDVSSCFEHINCRLRQQMGCLIDTLVVSYWSVPLFINVAQCYLMCKSLYSVTFVYISQKNVLPQLLYLLYLLQFAAKRQSSTSVHSWRLRMTKYDKIWLSIRMWPCCQ